MALHQLKFSIYTADIDPETLPATLPVMYKDDRVALAVFQDASYSYMLPDPISELLDAGRLEQCFAYRDEYGQLFGQFVAGRTLGSIQLVFPGDRAAWSTEN